MKRVDRIAIIASERLAQHSTLHWLASSLWRKLLRLKASTAKLRLRQWQKDEHKEFKFASKFETNLVAPKYTEIVETATPIERINVDVCIPVFNRFDMASRIMALVRDEIQFLESSTSYRFRVIIADDWSDARTANKLALLCDQYQFQYLRQEKNLGVVGNVNVAWGISNAPYFILLNSDAVIGPNALMNILSIFNADNSVGLITLPNFEDFKVHLGHSKSWAELNNYLSASRMSKLHYVDACTAISYAIGVRRESLKTDWLMDPIYGRGYGEDSDLHYQVVTNGWRSVLTLDTVAAHEGGATFGNDDDVKDSRSWGRNVFFQRWGSRYYAEIAEHSSCKAKAISLRTNGLEQFLSSNSRETTWVISPGISDRIGGLRVAEQYAIRECLKGSKIRFVCTQESSPKNIGDFLLSTPPALARNAIQPGDKIVLFGIGGIRWLRSLKKPLDTLKITFAAQGPDDLIWPEGFGDFRFLAQNVKSYLINSEVMKKVIEDLVGAFDFEELVPELGYAIYSGHSANSTRPIDVLMIVRDEWGKNPNYHAALANYLSLYCAVTVVTDLNLGNYSESVEVLPTRGNAEILKLMKISKSLVDASLFEGFGMVAREAAYCGAHVFLLGNAGGTDGLLEFKNHFSKLGPLWDVHGSARKIVRTIKGSEPCSGCDFCEKP